MERMRLSIAYHDDSGYSGELSVNVHEVQPFEWQGSEGSSASVSKYMKFLEETIPPGDTNSWIDVSGKHQFLSVDAGEYLPRNMRGTSDAALCRSQDVANGTPSTGIRVLVERKLPGMDRGACLYQAATELVLANVHAPLCSPVVVLTDLRGLEILWPTQKSVMVWDLDGKGARAVSVIRSMLYEEQARDGRVIWLQQGEDDALTSLRQRHCRRQHQDLAPGVDMGDESSALRLAELHESFPEVVSAVDVANTAGFEMVRRIQQIPCFWQYKVRDDGKDDAPPGMFSYMPIPDSWYCLDAGRLAVHFSVLKYIP